MNIETLNNISTKILNLLNIEVSTNNLIKIDALILTVLVITCIAIILFLVRIFFLKKENTSPVMDVLDKNISSVIPANMSQDAQPSLVTQQVTQSKISQAEEVSPSVSISQTTESKVEAPETTTSTTSPVGI